MPNFRKAKLRLLRENPYCYWCGKRVFDYITKDGEIAPDFMASVDHVLSKMWRQANINKDWEKVLSCVPCNQERATEEISILSKIQQK